MLLNRLSERKKDILCYAAMVLCIHMYKFTNYLPTWDSMYGIKMDFNQMTHFGRWLAGLSSMLLHTKADLQWPEGVLSAVLIALSLAVIFELFDMRRRPLTLIAAFLFAAFPSMAATFAYSLWGPAYMLALFLAVVGTWLAIHGGKREVALGGLLFGLSFAIYQLYITVAMILFVFYWADQSLGRSVTLREIAKTGGRFLLCVLIGLGIYYLGVMAVKRVFSIELSSYQGISEVGLLSPVEYAKAARYALGQFLYFFHGGYTPAQITFYTLLNLCIALMLAYLITVTILKNPDYSLKKKILLCLCFFSVCPLTYGLCFIAHGVGYHTLMVLGNYFVYFFGLLLLNHSQFHIKPAARAAALSLLAVLCFYHFLNDNNAYHQMSMSYQKTEFEISEILMDYDHLPEEERSGSAIAVIGDFLPSPNKEYLIPKIQGASMSNFLVSQYHFCQFANYYYGRQFSGCSNEDIERIRSSEAFLAMPSFPTAGYIRTIDGITVIKLVQQGEA